MSIENSIMLQRKNRKRSRGFSGEHSAKSIYHGGASALLCVLIGLVKITLGQPSLYNACFDKIRSADDNGDLFLSKEEYSKFLVTVSGGAILLQNETPPVLSNPYKMRQNTNSQQLNIRGINSLANADERSDMESFCQQIYSGLASIFHIQIEVKACTDAFQMSDANPQNGVLTTNEYAFFVVNVSKDVSLINSSFDELSKTLRDVFSDFSDGGEVLESLGEDYLIKFCERAAVAANIDDVIYATMPTKEPSKAPITAKPVTTNMPITAAPISNMPVVSISEEYAKCKTDLIVSDLNRNTVLDSDEYGYFLEELSDKKVSATAFANLHIIFRDTYSTLVEDNGEINLSGFRPGRTPSTDDNENLIRICKQTAQAIVQYETEENNDAVPGPSSTPVESSNSTELTEIELKACKKFMVLSDRNRNSVLDESEFVGFVTRMTTTIDLTGYELDDLDSSLRVIYEEKATSGDGIDIDGSKPGQQSTPIQEKHFRILCTDVYEAIEVLEANGMNTKVPTSQISPSQAPSLTRVQISDEFFRVCKTAMLVADMNRDDILEADEYVRFLNRLTISEFSGKAFVELDPVLQQGFLSVALDGKVDVYGSKPGITTSNDENEHLRRICESVNVAIEGYHNGTNTSTGTQRSVCETKLLQADSNHDNALNKAEYVVYLRLITGINYSWFDALPYLLRDQYDWFRLGKSTINIAGLSNQSIPLQGDKIRISWICDRTSKSIEITSKYGSDKNFTDFCDAAVKVADNNTDGFLNNDEFLFLIDGFTLDGKHRYNLSAADAVFMETFDRLKQSELNLVDIKVAKKNGLCENMANATESGRERETLLRICTDSLKLADIDRNGRLNQTEYIPFIDSLVAAYNMSISSSGDFEGLKSSDNAIDIQGIYNTNSSINDYKNLRSVCMTVGNAFGIIQSSNLEVVAVYNSFQISNEVGLSAEQLIPDSDVRRGLHDAYTAFVDYEIKASSQSHGRYLMLRGAAVTQSEIYQITDSTCPLGSTPDESCQTVFAAFNVTVPVASYDDPPIDIGSLLSNKTQDSIDRGTLQLMLSTIDPNNTIMILKSSQPLKPEVDEGPDVDEGDELNTVDIPDEKDSTTSGSEERSYVVFTAIAGAVVGSSIFGAALFYLFVSRQKKQKETNAVEKAFIGVDELSPTKLSVPINDNVLEEGRNPTPHRFVFSTEHSEGDVTCGLSETNHTSFQNVSQKASSTYSFDRNTATMCSFSEQQNISNTKGNGSFVNRTSDFKINDESESSYDPEEGTNGTSGVCVDDGFLDTDKNIPAASSNCCNILSHESNPKATEFQNAIDITGENTIENCDERQSSSWPTLEISDDNDESGSFEEIEVESDEDIEENVIVEVCETSGEMRPESTAMLVKNISSMNDFDNDNRDTSCCVDEYEDISEEEIEISVHDTDESTRCVVKERSQVDSTTRVDSDNEAESENDNEEEEEEEEERSESEEETSASEENSVSDDTSQNSDTDEQDDLSTNSSNAGLMTSSYQKYRPVIEQLIRQVMPDEIDNINVMMEQFVGNEKELVTSLRNMAGIDDSDDEESGSDDSETVSSDSDDKHLTKVESSSSEEEESEEEDVEVKNPESGEEDTSEEEDEDEEESEEEDTSEEDEEEESEEEETSEVSDDEESSSEEVESEEEDSEDDDEDYDDESNKGNCKVACTAGKEDSEDDDDDDDDDDSSEYESD